MVSLWESDVSEPSIRDLAALAELYGTTSAVLLQGLDWPEPTGAEAAV
jgi:hypothetical protein